MRVKTKLAAEAARETSSPYQRVRSNNRSGTVDSMSRYLKLSALDKDAAVRAGLPAGFVREVAERAGLPAGKVVNLIGIGKSTLHRLEHEGKVLPHSASDRIARIAEINAQAERLLGGMEHARHWLSTPHRILGSKRPIDLMSTDAGCQLVLDTLRRIEYGVYA